MALLRLYTLRQPRNTTGYKMLPLIFMKIFKPKTIFYKMMFPFQVVVYPMACTLTSAIFWNILMDV